MDAEPDQKTPTFVAMAHLLRSLGVKAPEIYAASPAQGVVLLEDFGTRNIGALLDAGEAPKPSFLRATALLAKIHQRFHRSMCPELDLPVYTVDLFVNQLDPFLDAYLPSLKQREATEAERQDFRAAWYAVLRPLEIMPRSLLLRDYMPDNLMELAKEEIGVLDFQDAGIGPTAYDLASLCEEVRRDGGFALLPELIAFYCEQSETPLSQADLLRACTLLSAQRHTRILGIITKLAAQTGKRDKLAYLPRIRRHLTHILATPYLNPVRDFMHDFESASS